ncbi:hypothetical protein EBU24_01190 [bacterium]|nr:hypothetical protein [bacterium]
MKAPHKLILSFLVTTFFSLSLCQEDFPGLVNAEQIIDKVDYDDSYHVKSLTEICARKILEISYEKISYHKISNEKNPIGALQLLHASLSSVPEKSKTIKIFSRLLKESNFIQTINYLGESLAKQEREVILFNFLVDPINTGKKFFSESIPFITNLLTQQKLPILTNSRLDQIKALGGLAILIHKTTKDNIQPLREALAPIIDVALEEHNNHYLQLMIDNNLFCYCDLQRILETYFVTGNEEILKTIDQLNFTPLFNPYANTMKYEILDILGKFSSPDNTLSEKLEYLKEIDVSPIRNPYVRNYFNNIKKSENLELLSEKYIQENLPDLYEQCDELKHYAYPEEFIECFLVGQHNFFLEEQENLHGRNYTINQNILDAYQKNQEKISKILTCLIGNKKILDPFLDKSLQEDQKEKSFFAQYFEKKMNKPNNNVLRIDPFLQRNIALFLRILKEQNKYNPTKEEVVENAWKNRSWRYILRDAYPNYFTPEVIERPRKDILDTNGDFSLLNSPKEEKVKLFYKEADCFMWALTGYDSFDRDRFLRHHYFHTQYDSHYPLGS